jgi:hypothetical protein
MEESQITATLMKMQLACTWLVLVLPCVSGQEPGKPTSHEELFLGLKQPFAKRAAAPAPGGAPKTTAEALYGNEVFLHLRNDFPKEITDYLAPCFSKDLLAHFDQSRAEVDRWMEGKKNAGLKLPMSEGAIFVGCYDGVSTFRLGETTVEKDRALQKVHLTYIEDKTTIEWVDTAVLIRIGEKWLLDDVVFGDGNSTLRKRTRIDTGNSGRP